MSRFVKMKVAGVALDPDNGAPIVILKDFKEDLILPIWIGLMEANAIAAELEGVNFARPMTHDLFKMLLDEIGGVILAVKLVDVREDVFYAEISLEAGGRLHTLDARPSDAIAIALRTKAEIYVAENVIAKATKIETRFGHMMNIVGFESDAEKLKLILEEMKPEDFGKYNA